MDHDRAYGDPHDRQGDLFTAERRQIPLASQGGRVGDVRRSRQRLRRCVEDESMPNHVRELTTRRSYSFELRRLPRVREPTIRLIIKF